LSVRVLPCAYEGLGIWLNAQLRTRVTSKVWFFIASLSNQRVYDM
jgi:hypothetical protein